MITVQLVQHTLCFHTNTQPTLYETKIMLDAAVSMYFPIEMYLCMSRLHFSRSLMLFLMFKLFIFIKMQTLL